MARVLITRAQPQAERTAQLVQARGHAAVIAPLTRIVADMAGLERLRTLPAGEGIAVATSARALEALEGAGLSDWVAARRWAVVGRRAADLVQGFGGTLACPPAPDVSQLIKDLSALDAPLVYLAGVDRKPMLEEAFPGMAVVEMYQAQALAGLSTDQVAGLRADPPSHGLVYSVRSAQLVGAAIHQAGLAKTLAQMRWLCLSEECGEALARKLPQVRVQLAPTPDEAALLGLLSSPGG